MYFGIVVLELLLFLLWCEASKRVLQVQRFVLAAYHESDLATWIGGDVDISVLDVREDVAAVLKDRNNQVQMNEVVLSCTPVLEYP